MQSRYCTPQSLILLQFHPVLLSMLSVCTAAFVINWWMDNSIYVRVEHIISIRSFYSLLGNILGRANCSQGHGCNDCRAVFVLRFRNTGQIHSTPNVSSCMVKSFAVTCYPVPNPNQSVTSRCRKVLHDYSMSCDDVSFDSSLVHENNH